MYIGRCPCICSPIQSRIPTPNSLLFLSTSSRSKTMEKVGASLTASTSENATPANEYVLLSPSSSFSSSSIASALRFLTPQVSLFLPLRTLLRRYATFCFFTKKSLIDVNVEIVAVLLARSSTSTSEIVPLSKSTFSLESSNILSATGGVSRRRRFS